MSDIYQRLRERLDQLSTGYPATAGGVELRILRRLFSEQDAAVNKVLERAVQGR